MARRLLITGSQLWTDTTVIRDGLAQVWHPDTILMSGACPRGADRLCEQCWTRWGGRVDRYPARWIVEGHYRRDAGFRRNEQMVAAAIDLAAQRCLAFVLDDSPGATHTVGLARRAGLWTTVYRASSTAAGVIDAAVDAMVDLGAACLPGSDRSVRLPSRWGGGTLPRPRPGVKPRNSTAA